MAILNIGGREVTVDDGFLKLSPEQQNATVEEIAASLGGSRQAEQTPSPVDPQGAFDAAARRVRKANIAPERAAFDVGKLADDLVRRGANSMTFGLADKFAGGMDALTGQAPSYDEGVKAQRARTEKIAEERPGVALAGDLAGGVAGGVGLMKSGVTLAGRVGPGLLPRILAFGGEGGLYGGAHGAGNTYSGNPMDYVQNAKNGAATGALIGGGLPALGSGAGGAYRAGAAFLGPRIEGAGRGASAMMRAAAQADEAGIRNLPQMGPDAMLVDAGPAMLGLGQGAGTGTGPGRTQLVEALTRRDAGTGPRLARALDDNLGPAPIPSRVEANLSGNRAFVAQEYAPLMENARAVDTAPLAERLETIAINLRGPEQRAVRQVREMLDIPGSRGVLDPHPRALLSTRQSIDGLMASETNPQVVQQLTAARAAVDDELARAVPGIKQVDARVHELHRQSEGLQRGSQVFDTGKTAIRPVELTDEVRQAAVPQGEMVGPSATPVRIRQGARGEIDRIVGTNVNDLNALERKLGTPQDWNAQKMATVFGDEPTARVVRALMDNRQFRDSYQKIVQNSQTAQRTSAANAMEGSSGGNVPTDTTLTGLGLKALNAVAKALSGASSASTKDEIGRLLSSQGPAVQRIARELLESAQTATANSNALSRTIGAPQWIGATGPLSGRAKSQ